MHVLLYLSRKKGIRAIHLKEALFNIATKTTIKGIGVKMFKIIFDEPKGGVDNFFFC
jgi:hypothetical protein